MRAPPSLAGAVAAVVALLAHGLPFRLGLFCGRSPVSSRQRWPTRCERRHRPRSRRGMNGAHGISCRVIVGLALSTFVREPRFCWPDRACGLNRRIEVALRYAPVYARGHHHAGR
jgi:hypothetical protein